MAAGTWTGTEQKRRAGIYINFIKAATAQITGGARGVVGMPIFNYAGTAEAGKFYTVEGEKDAKELFGSAGAEPILRVLSGGAKEVLAYAVAQIQIPENGYDFTAIRDEYEARDFNVFVYPEEVEPAEQDAAKAWTVRNRNEGKHFLFVVGGAVDEDQDVKVGNARSIRMKDDYVVNLINGVILADGSELHSGLYASYIAGLIAGTPINKAITFVELPVVDVNKRFKNSEIESALISGSLVLINDGRKVKIERGITTNSNEQSLGKIRGTRARQAVATDIAYTAADNYIGQLDNNADGQAALISAIKAYLEMLEGENVLSEPLVTLDPNFQSVGDSVYLAISYVETDSMERIFLTINV